MGPDEQVIERSKLCPTATLQYTAPQNISAKSTISKVDIVFHFRLDGAGTMPVI